MTSPANANERRAVVSGIGMITSLGQTDQCCTAARAGLRRVVEWDGYFALGLDEQFDPREPISVAPAPIAVTADDPTQRLVELTLPAIEEALQSAQLSRADLSRTSFSVCLSTAPDENQNVAAGEVFLGALYEAGALPPMRENRIYFQGHAAGAIALHEAAALIANGSSDIVLLGGAETFLDVNMLDQLDRDCRIRSSRAVDGYTPGEAAVFLVLESATSARRRGARSHLSINSVGFGNEPAPLKSRDVCTAQGLCAAIRSASALAQSGGTAPASGWTISDFNGERWRAKEWGLALPRLNKMLGENMIHWHPAQNFGDVGSASVPLLLSVAAQAFDGGYAPRPTALILASSDGADRSAILVSAGDANAR